MLPLAAVVLWGGNAIVAKASAGLIGAAQITFYRWLLASFLLAPFAVGAAIGHRAQLLRRLPYLGVLGFLGCAMFPYLMYLAAQHTSAVNIGIIQTMTPLMTLGITQIWSRTSTPARAVVGLAVSFLGVCLVLSRGHPVALFTQAPNLGDLLMLAATACFALYSVLLQRWRSDLPGELDLFVQAVVGALLLAPLVAFAPSELVAHPAWPLIGYAALFGSVAAPLLWISGVARLGSARATMYLNLLPLVTAVLAVTILGEPLEVALLLGGVLVVGGVILAERQPDY